LKAAGDGAGAPEGRTREPLLLVHGLGASASVWDPVVPLLAREREVIALDLPGFGIAPSLPPEVEPTAAALAAALRDQLAARGIDTFDVAGNSLGAWVGLELGRLGAARSVTCLSPAGLWRKPLGPAKGAACGRWSRSPSASPRCAAAPCAPSPPVPRTSRPPPAASWSSAGSTPTATTARTRRCASTSSNPPATRPRSR
jgi:pimeloyl-ACP methyl ester carboxylesterase